MNDKLLRLYCTSRAWMHTLEHQVRTKRESGQTATEYLGMLTVLAAALFIGQTALKGDEDDAGPVVETMHNAMKSTVNKALEALGVS